jgi:hypothetical protein
MLMIFTISCVTAQKQDDTISLGLPGDNLNLFAVLDLFQESKTLESFEKSLNDKDTKINNLDLNNDDKIDYIRLEDIAEGGLHNIILKVDLNEEEQQDVALFIVESNDDGGVTIQLIGDESLYGKDYIVEPNYSEETPNPGYTKETSSTLVVNNYTTQETANWTIVRFIFAPSYVVWRSPWYWNYYPGYWNPWRPWYWHQYYGYHSHWHNHYYGHYHRPSFYRNPIARKTYRKRYHKSSFSFVKNVNKGVYKKTYSKPETRVVGSKIYTKRYPNKVTSKVSNKSVKPALKSNSTIKKTMVKSHSNVKRPKSKNQSIRRPTKNIKRSKTNRKTSEAKNSLTPKNPSSNSRSRVSKGTSTKTKPSIQKRPVKSSKSGKKSSRSRSNGIK